MSDLLQEICAVKRKYIAQCKAGLSLKALERMIAHAPPPRDFAGALRVQREAGKFGLIAEMKRASPSAGLLRADFDAAAIALAYKAGGAACLSVLTDQLYFRGRDEDIAAAASADLPILRKDFMLDVYQIAETRALGGDCVLLIMAALTDTQALELHDAAARYGLAVLAEAHDRSELERALALPNAMIGINNRDLKNLATDIAVTRELAPLAPKDRLVISESGLRAHADLAELAAHGAGCFLIGEHLLRQDDLTAATRAMLGG